MKSAGQKVGKGFTQGLQGGLKQVPSIAAKTTATVATRLNAGRASAYSAGAYISAGFAAGMLSQLATIRAAAAQMAAAADKAVRAKAKIHSPSRMTMKDGAYFGQGWVEGILSEVKAAKNAMADLIYIPQIRTPKLAGAYGGELSADYSYSNNSEIVITVPVELDGKEVARATAKYDREEANKLQRREDRKKGKA